MATANIDIILGNGDKAGKTINELRQQVNRLTKEINRAEVGSEEFIKKSADLKKVIARLKEVRDQTKQVSEANNGVLEKFMEYVPFSGQLQNVIGNVKGLTLGFQGLRAALVATGLGALLVLIGSLVSFFTKFQGGIDIVTVTMEGLGAVLNELIGRIATFGKGLWEILNGNFSEGAELLSKSFDNLGDSIKSAFNEGRDIAQARIELERFTRAQEVANARLSATAERNRAIADDATRSFKERETAAALARSAEEKRSKSVLNLAQQELEILNREIALKQRQGLVTDELAQKQADAQIKVIEAEKEAMTQFLDNEKVRRELIQDRLERDLDILIDGFDNVKTINEKIIENERVTFDERAKKLDELTQLAQGSFNKQIETIQEFTGKQVDAYDLLNTADAEQLNNKIRNLELSEIIEGRLLEIIRERRTVLSDFTQLEKEINEQRAEQELEVANRIADLRIQVMKDGQQKEIEAIELDTERKIEALIGSEEQIREQKALLLDLEEQRKEEVRQKYRDKQLAEDKKLADEQKRIREEMAQAERDIEDARVDTLATTGEAFADLLENEGKNAKAAKDIRKGLAIFEIQESLQRQLASIEVASFNIAKNIPAPAGPALAATYRLTQRALAFINAGARLVQIRKMQKGGLLEGPLHTQGGIPAVVGGAYPVELEGGEFIFSRKAVSGIGSDVLSNINAKFETGGPVNPFTTNSRTTTRDQEVLDTSQEQNDQLLTAFMTYAERVEAWQRNLKVNNNVQETREGLETINKLEQESRF